MPEGPTELKFQIESALQTNAGPQDLIGRPYRFASNHGSHHEDLVGTIQSVGYSDTSGLTLYVSSACFAGMRLIGISHVEGVWRARTDHPDDRRTYAGELEIFGLPAVS